jgi:hypothetical protein
LRESQKEDPAQLRLPTTRPASPYQQGGRLRSDQVVAFGRIGWLLSIGIGGRIPSDSASELRRYSRRTQAAKKLGALGPDVERIEVDEAPDPTLWIRCKHDKPKALVVFR